MKKRLSGHNEKLDQASLKKNTNKSAICHKVTDILLDKLFAAK